MQISPSEKLEMLQTVYDESIMSKNDVLNDINISEKAQNMWTTMKGKVVP
jgi:hypothetical protein